MNVVKMKQTIVEVNRFYRPTEYVCDKNGDENWMIASNRGVTVMFTLNYVTQKFTARWSICNGDNFCKITGIQYAQACSSPIVGNLAHQGSGINLLTLLIDELYSMIKWRTFAYTKTEIHNFKLMLNELQESI